MSHIVFTKEETLLVMCFYMAQINGASDQERSYITEVVVPMEQLSADVLAKTLAKWEVLVKNNAQNVDDIIIASLLPLSAADRVRILAWALIVAGGEVDAAGAEKIETDVLVDFALRLHVDTALIIIKARAIALEVRTRRLK
ncbi:MAG: hypothetical protein HZC28_06945 [Spirochaetes bacterium]|nr:hypothetical protein [Spirochaetota bacterium]